MVNCEVTSEKRAYDNSVVNSGTGIREILSSQRCKVAKKFFRNAAALCVFAPFAGERDLLLVNIVGSDSTRVVVSSSALVSPRISREISAKCASFFLFWSSLRLWQQPLRRRPPPAIR